MAWEREQAGTGVLRVTLKHCPYAWFASTPYQLDLANSNYKAVGVGAWQSVTVRLVITLS